MAGLMWNWSFPINKESWTSSYVAVHAPEWPCVALATIMWLVDVQNVRRLDETLRDLRHEPDGRVRGIRRDGAVHLLDLQGELGRKADLAAGGYLPRAVRVVAGAGQRVARLRRHLRGVLVRHPVRALQAEHRPEGVARRHERSEGSRPLALPDPRSLASLVMTTSVPTLPVSSA